MQRDHDGGARCVGGAAHVHDDAQALLADVLLDIAKALAPEHPESVRYSAPWTSGVPMPEHLVISLPDCPSCLEEVACDGSSYWCERCGGTWDMNGTSTVSDADA